MAAKKTPPQEETINTNSSQSSQSSQTIKRLYRSETERMLGGVAGGLGDYLQVDATVIRLVFVLLAFFGGSGVFFYLIMWLIVPTKSSNTPNVSESFDEMKAKAEVFSSSMRNTTRPNNSYLLSILIIALGVFLLSKSFTLFSVDLHQLIPVVLIVLGFFFIFRR